MEKYQSYKPSDVEWIGEIPYNWEETRLKYVGNLYGGLTGKSGEDFKQEDNPNNKPYIPYTNIFRNTYISKTHVDYVVLEDGENQNKVQKFDLFFLMSSETYQDLGKPCILIDDIEELYLNSFCKGFRVNRIDVNPLFLNYQLLGSIHKELISIEGRGFTRINLRQDRLNETPIILPPIQEQQQIVQFLDEKTELIDNLISTKERKISLLNEQRTSLINQVVTKGLNPNVKMKNTGIEWIGEIPEHWIISKLKWITLEHRQGYYSSNDYDDSGYRMVRITDINDDNTITVENSPFYEIEETDYLRFGLTNGDFLFPRTGGVGRFGIFDSHIQSIYGSFLIRFRFTNEIIHSFIKFYLNSSIFLTEIEKEIHGGVNKNVHVENIKDCIIVYPKSTSEQLQIVKHLDEKTKEIDDLVELEQKKIDLLKEYRQSLISEVVTGKIKVTN